MLYLPPENERTAVSEAYLTGKNITINDREYLILGATRSFPQQYLVQLVEPTPEERTPLGIMDVLHVERKNVQPRTGMQVGTIPSNWVVTHIPSGIQLKIPFTYSRSEIRAREVGIALFQNFFDLHGIDYASPGNWSHR